VTAVAVRWLATGAPPRRVVRRPSAAAVAPPAAGDRPRVAAGNDPSPTRERAGTLFLVPGIGAATGTSGMFRLDPAALGLNCEHTAYFSYAGTSEGAPQGAARCPITRGAP
jgi:hypothetical protein